MKVITHIAVAAAIVLSAFAVATAVEPEMSPLPENTLTQCFTEEICTETTECFSTECTETESVTSTSRVPEKETTIQTTEADTVTVVSTEITEKTSRKTVAKETTETETTTGKQTEYGKKFRITLYTPDSDGGKWGYSTATGVTSKHLQTCAVDPSVIPLGSTIIIGNLTLLACDTGSAVKGNVIDIFFDGSEQEAVEWLNSFGDYHTIEII